MRTTFKRKNRDIVEEFALLIRREMHLQDVSLSELARRSGFTRPYLHRVLAGQHSPSLECCEKVAQALGMRVDFQKYAT